MFPWHLTNRGTYYTAVTVNLSAYYKLLKTQCLTFVPVLGLREAGRGRG